MSAEDSIRRLLVRYGRSGNVAWFGTVHSNPFARGDAVVVLTALGQWPGVILRSEAPPTGSPPSLSGELLRRIGNSDQEAITTSRGASAELVELARREVRGGSLTVIDAEVSLCGRFAVILFAGRGGAALGPAAVRLASAMGLERVQWIGADSLAATTDESGPTNALGSPEGDTAAQDSADESSTATGVAAENEEVVGARDAIAALHSRDSTELGTRARRQRERLGMVGAYSQKIRERPRDDGGLGPDAARRCWMLRMRATAGGVTVGQLTQLAELAKRHGDGSLRLTMRQGLQMHGVAAGDGAETLRAIHALAMTTRGSCGNVFRNVTCCPLPPQTPAAVAARHLAATITQQWLPRAEWLDWAFGPEESRVDRRETAEVEAAIRDAAYPGGYLPHKWKIGVAAADDNCIDVLTNDVGLVVHGGAGGASVEVDCYVGGSLAYRPGVTGSEAMLAEPLGRIAVADVGPVLDALARLHREISTTGSRPWRRLKYLVRRMGTEDLTARIQQRIGRQGIFAAVAPEPPPPWAAHPAWVAGSTWGAAGLWTRTIGVARGRLRFGTEQAGEDWLRLCRLGRAMRIGPRHSLVIDGIETKDKPAVDEGVDALVASEAAEWEDRADEGEAIRRVTLPRVLACVALPTCPLAVAEAERAADQWRQALGPVVAEAARLAAVEEPQRLTVAISGCSNGCSHPLTASLGIVAEGPRQYRVFIGGDGRTLGISLGTVTGPEELPGLVRTAAKR